MKIAVAAGHTLTGLGSGAVGVLNESNETRIIASKLVNMLKSDGHEVKYLVVDAPNPQSASLQDCYTRADQANIFGADLYIEIHLNAFNGSAYGTEVLVNKLGGNAENVARKVVNSIAELGFFNRGVKTENLIVLNRTKMSAILVECCFCDSQTDYKLYNTDKIAAKIYKGIVGKEYNIVQSNTQIPSNQICNVQNPNATIVNDFLYVRDENGNKTGDVVNIGTRIKAFYVLFDKQLLFIEYPVNGTTKQGFVTNATNCIQYTSRLWKNGSTPEKVYDDFGNRVGLLNPRETAYVLQEKQGKWYIIYNTSKGINTKSGWVNYHG